MSDSQILIAGHAVIDEILDSPGSPPRYSLGGPVSYSSIALKQLSYSPSIATKIGSDFPKKYLETLLHYSGIEFSAYTVLNSKTTSYRIDRSTEPRKLWLLAKCKPLSSEDIMSSTSASDCTRLIINTVANEVSIPSLRELRRKFSFIALDSQGFLREFASNGLVKLASKMDSTEYLSGIDVVKADAEELCAWAGTNNLEIARRKVLKQSRVLLLTSGGGPVELHVEGTLRFRAIPPKVVVNDTTGCGDIMLSVFVAEIEEGLRRALGLSIAAGSLAAQNIGVKKAILKKNELEQVLKSIYIEEF